MMQFNSTTQNLLPLMGLLILQACSGDKVTPLETGQSEEAQANSNRINIPATVRRNLGIEFTQVQVRKVAQTLRVPGSFELRPLAHHEYRMALPGRVELLVEQNERVTEGQLLYRYESTAWPELLHEIVLSEQAILTATGKIQVATSRSQETRQNLTYGRKRLELLAEANFQRADLEASTLELEASLPRLDAELRLARTELSNAERTREHALHRAAAAVGLKEQDLVELVEIDGRVVSAYETLDSIEVRARHSGVVEHLALTDGSFAEAPSLVLTTVDTSQVRFRALALQADWGRIGNITEVYIVPPLGPGVDPGTRIAATMVLGLDAQPVERTMTLLATPQTSAAWIRPGVSAFLEIVTASSDGPCLAIPSSSVLRDGLSHVFFRRDPKDPGVAIRVEADLGIDDGRWVEIQSGLMRGDEVVSAGAYELKLATQQGGKPNRGGHMHADGTFHEGED